MSAAQTVRPTIPAISQQCDLRIREKLDLAHNAVSPAKLARAAAAFADGVLRHADGIRMLERLSRGVQRVSHMRMHCGNAVLCRPRAHPSGDSLIVGKLA